MNRMTKYWRRKVRAVRVLLNGQTGTDAATVRNWIVALSGSENDNDPITGLAGDLEDKLEALILARNDVTGAENEHRRSARLVDMVQRAINARPNGKGFYASVADVADPQDNVASFYNTYRTRLQEASTAAALFLAKAKNKPTGVTAITDALKVLIKAAGVKPWVREEIGSLIVAMDNAKPDGGSGEGSANWPSSWISSSSGG